MCGRACPVEYRAENQAGENQSLMLGLDKGFQALGRENHATIPARVKMPKKGLSARSAITGIFGIFGGKWKKSCQERRESVTFCYYFYFF